MKSAQEIAYARLLNHGLTAEPTRSPHQLMRHLLTMQGQALPNVIGSVALRTRNHDMNEVRESINRGGLVRSWTQRGTIHLTAAEDLSWILDLTGERALKAATRNREALGVTPKIIDQAATVLAEHIEQHGPVSRETIRDLWQPLGASDVPGRTYRLLLTLMNMQLFVHGPLADGSISSQLITTSQSWLPKSPALDRDEALTRVALRYFTGHGPATLEDLVRWIALPKTWLRKGIAAAGDALASFQLDGATYFHDPSLPDRIADSRRTDGVFLLPAYDELILGYKDRSPNLHPDNEVHICPRRNGVFKHTIFQGPIARGTWNFSRRKTGPAITIEPFPGHILDEAEIHAQAEIHPLITWGP